MRIRLHFKMVLNMRTLMENMIALRKNTMVQMLHSCGQQTIIMV